MPAWRITTGGLELRFKLTPKSSRDAVETIEDTANGPALKARVTAVPEDGKANAALIALVAQWLGIPKSDIKLIVGHKSRIKTLKISGNAEILAARITTLLKSQS